MFGKRSDGIRVKDKCAIMEAAPFMLGNRIESQNYYSNPVRCDSIDEFIAREKKNGVKFTYNHILIATLVRLLYLRPRLNYFINNNLKYIHKEIIVSMNVKRVLKDDGEEIIPKFKFTGRESIYEIKDIIDRQLADELSKDAKENPTVKTASLLLKLPKWLFRFVFKVMQFMDKHNFLPKSLIEDSSFHCSVYVTNLKSIKLDAIYHHLFNFGTASLFIAMGKEKIVPVVEDNKEIKLAKVMTLGITMDDRVADGFYYGKSLKLWNDMFANLDCLKETMPDDGSLKLKIKKKKTKKSKTKKTKITKNQEDNQEKNQELENKNKIGGNND